MRQKIYLIIIINFKLTIYSFYVNLDNLDKKVFQSIFKVYELVKIKKYLNI